MTLNSMFNDLSLTSYRKWSKHLAASVRYPFAFLRTGTGNSGTEERKGFLVFLVLQNSSRHQLLPQDQIHHWFEWLLVTIVP